MKQICKKLFTILTTKFKNYNLSSLPKLWYQTYYIYQRRQFFVSSCFNQCYLLGFMFLLIGTSFVSNDGWRLVLQIKTNFLEQPLFFERKYSSWLVQFNFQQIHWFKLINALRDIGNWNIHWATLTSNQTCAMKKLNLFQRYIAHHQFTVDGPNSLTYTL